MSERHDPVVLLVLRRAETVALLLATTIAALILILWFVPSLDGLPPPAWHKMTANAALGIFIAAISLVLTTRDVPSERLAGRAAACAVLAIGALTLTEYAAHLSFGIDTWLPHGQAGLFPGRPSPQTSFAFVLLAISLLTIEEDTNGWPLLGDIAALALVALMLVNLGGYVYGALKLDGIDAVMIMSPQTLTAFVCLALIMVAHRARKGVLLGVLVDIGLGSRMVRMILPVALVSPIVFFSSVDAMIKLGLVTAPYIHAEASATASFFILCLLSWMGSRINALEEGLREASLIDELTRIHNRRGFYFLGEQVMRNADRGIDGLTLFFFDLDGLKRVNDTLGHRAGSDMLQAFAAMLVGIFRKGDIVGRLGGDEFAVLAMGGGAIPHEAILARLEQGAADINKADARFASFAFSTGVAQLIPGETVSLAEMIARADALMYADKARRKVARPVNQDWIGTPEYKRTP